MAKKSVCFFCSLWAQGFMKHHQLIIDMMPTSEKVSWKTKRIYAKIVLKLLKSLQFKGN